MDAIGLMVTTIEEGFMHFTQVGGVDPRILPGQMVNVHGTAQGSDKAQDIPGMVVMPPAHLLPTDAPTGVLGLNHLFIDTGLEPKEVERLVRVGDFVNFAQEPMELAGETICGHTLDNRGSVAALTVCLDILSAASTFGMFMATRLPRKKCLEPAASLTRWLCGRIWPSSLMSTFLQGAWRQWLPQLRNRQRHHHHNRTTRPSLPGEKTQQAC